MKARRQLLPSICLILILLALFLYLLLSLGNFTFTSRQAVEPLYRDTVIEGERYRFYLWTDGTGAAIGDVKATKRYLFLWKQVEGDAVDILIDGADAGTLFSFEDGDVTHHFIRWTVTQITPGVDHYAYRTDRVTVNGVDTPLDRVSYFTTAEPIETLVIGGKTATLKP